MTATVQAQGFYLVHGVKYFYGGAARASMKM
jgi:hypothetical protein